MPKHYNGFGKKRIDSKNPFLSQSDVVLFAAIYHCQANLPERQMAATQDAQILYWTCRSEERAERANAYQQLGEFLLRVALSRLQSKPELHPHAEECAQEALVAIWQQLEAGQGPDRPERFLSWCASVVIHKVYDELRRLGYTAGEGDAGHGEVETQPAVRGVLSPSKGRTKRVPKEEQESFEQLVTHDDGTTVPWAERVADQQAEDPEAHVVEREGLVRLLLGIRDHPHLSDDSRKVLIFGFLAELTDDQLATRLGTSKSNIYVIRSRNLGKLRNDSEFVAQLRSHYQYKQSRFSSRTEGNTDTI